MAVVKNKMTEGNRSFWSHVESIADQVGKHSQTSRSNALFSNVREATKFCGTGVVSAEDAEVGKLKAREHEQLA